MGEEYKEGGERLDPARVGQLALQFDLEPPEAVIGWALGRWHSRVAVCTSFQAEGMVILDMAWRINSSVRVFTVDTGRLPQETYEVIERVRDRYGLAVEVYCPDAPQVEAMVRRHGPNLFYTSVDARLLCCQIRKVEPMRRALAGLGAWITGLRREQGASRVAISKIEIDHGLGGLSKINPLCDWTYQEVWDYIRAHDVPYHPLYEQGYTSIGCAPCTRPTQQGDDLRAGRWWWEQDTPKECGIHFSVSAAVRPSTDSKTRAL